MESTFPNGTAETKKENSEALNLLFSKWLDEEEAIDQRDQHLQR